jgi:hypothetical protein
MMQFPAQAQIKAIGSDTWASSYTWDARRQPKDFVTVLIPADITVRVDKNIKLNNVIIKISGALNFMNGSLDLDENSHIIIQSGGRISGSKTAEYIKIGGVTKYVGTNLSIGGYAFADATSGSSFLQGNFLPVTLIAFYAIPSGKNVNLSWSTAQEFNDNRFDIQKSLDGISWTNVSEIMSQGNNSMGAKYSFTDKNVPGSNVFYRIMQIDAFNHFQYSPVKRIVLGETEQTAANIYASSTKSITVEFNNEEKTSIRVNVVNLNGQLVARGEYPQSTYSATLNLPSSAKGMYIVQIIDNAGLKETKKLIF